MGKISIAAPDTTTTSVLLATYGESLLVFNVKVNVSNQLGNVTYNAWDFKNQTVVSSIAIPKMAGAGYLSLKEQAEVVGLSTFEIHIQGSIETNDLTNWSKSKILTNEYSKKYG